MRINQGIRRSDVGTKISWLHLKQNISRQKNKYWSEMNGLFLCPSLRIFLCCGHICSSFCFTLCCSELAARYFDHKSSEAQKPNPPICWVDKKISQKEKKEKCAVGERNSWILRDISFLEIVLWDSDWDPKIALLPQYCIRSPEMFGNRDWN